MVVQFSRLVEDDDWSREVWVVCATDGLSGTRELFDIVLVDSFYV